MAKGVKKIQYAGGRIYQSKSVLDKSLLVPADEFISFKVKDWEPETKEEDKKKSLTWIWQTNDKPKVIIGQMPVSTSKLFRFSIPKKLCGPYSYYIEASLSGKRATKDTGIYVTGFSTPLITKSKWCTSNDGKDVRKTKKFSYGEVIYLNLDTEGLNGFRSLIVEVYNRISIKEDKKIFTYSSVIVTDGEVNLELTNTAIWQGLIDNIKEEEEFYIKVKDGTGKYIPDGNGDVAHARYLRIKNQLVSNQPKVPTNLTPLKVGENPANKKRDELCRFSAITITETQKKDGKVEQTKKEIFKEGSSLVEHKAPQEIINRTVFFDFDQSVLNSESVKALDNLLNFLIANQHSVITIDGFACVIGKEKYNKELSLKRSEAVRNHFVNGGLDPKRIKCNAKGEIQLTDGRITGGVDEDKKAKDNLTHKDEKNYAEARRVDISFVFIGHDAKTIVYQTIAPSHDKDITLDVLEFDTKACVAGDKHKKQIRVKSTEYKKDKEAAATSMPIPIHSALAWWNVAPLQYIWPASTTPIKYFIDVHSCRYFTNGKNSTIVVNAYPDIKWKLDFFLNLTNDLSVKWMNMDPYEHKELQKRAGKMGAEKRWKQKDASFGFSLKAKWDDDKQEKELKYEYEAKFKKIYDLFSSIGALSDGITNKTKGTMRSVSPKGIPVSFAVKPPNLSLAGDWLLAHPKNDNKIIGTDLAIALNANPLIGLEITIDLLGAIVFAAGSVVGAAPGVTELYKKIQGQLKSGIDVGNDNAGFKANIDIYMDLIISGTTNIGSEFKFNTAGKLKDSKFKIESENKLKIELKVGVKIKGEAVVVIIKAEAYFEASAAGNASITYGHGVNYDDKGLYYRPKLGFDGLHAEYIIQVSASLAIKIAKDKHKVEESRGGKHVFAEGTYKNVIPPFDVIEELEKLFGMSANVVFIKSD